MVGFNFQLDRLQVASKIMYSNHKKCSCHAEKIQNCAWIINSRIWQLHVGTLKRANFFNYQSTLFIESWKLLYSTPLNISNLSNVVYSLGWQIYLSLRIYSICNSLKFYQVSNLNFGKYYIVCLILPDLSKQIH